jgi:RNA polymerase sigma-70 factor (ECF subfamily)
MSHMATRDQPRILPASLPQGIPDAELAARAARGDQAAFERIMRLHNRTLFRTARAILSDDGEAEDALQEAYLQAYRSLGGFRGDAKLSTWLARIVANQALQRLRKRERRAEIVPMQAGVADQELEEAADMNTDQGPEAATHGIELRKVLEKQIDALPDAYRAVFMLRAVEELTVEEAAAILGIPEATVRSRFFRARSLLREALAQKIDLACEDAFAFDGARCDRVVGFVIDQLNRQERT